MLIESRLILTKSFPRGISKISFGNYQISPVSYFSSTEIEALLTFTHEPKDSGEDGHPEEEVDIICKLLSVFLNARIRKLGTVADENNIPVFDGRERLQYPQFFGYLDPEPVDDLIKRTLMLDINLARHFIRACRCYAYALELIPSDPAFAFFLFVTGGNCISSRDETIPYSDLDPVDKQAERFSKFISEYVPDMLKTEGLEDDQFHTGLLENTYKYHRNVFIHDGKEITSASREADKTGANYSQVEINGNEVSIPGLGWLSNVIRGALVGYLKVFDQPSGDSINENLFSTIALEKAKLKTNQ